MDIRTHVYSSTLLGGSLYAVTHSPQIAVFAFLSGVFLDIDHIFDFLIFSEDRISIKKLLLWCDDGKWEKITLVFHSYELYFILGIITYYFPYEPLIGILFGMGLHLIVDQIGNRYIIKKFRLSLFFYFLIYRIYVGFHKKQLRFDRQ
jgi:hypothetical protein